MSLAGRYPEPGPKLKASAAAEEAAHGVHAPTEDVSTHAPSTCTDIPTPGAEARPGAGSSA